MIKIRQIKIKTKNKQGQILGMPFQLIFSLLLIAVFFVAAGIVVRNMLERANQAKVALFSNELQSRITETWYAAEASKSHSFELPSAIKWICFGSLNEPKNISGIKDAKEREAANVTYDTLKREYSRPGADLSNLLLFWPSEYVKGLGLSPIKKIKCDGSECVDFSALPANPYCIENRKGGFTLTLSKQLGEKFVRIK